MEGELKEGDRMSKILNGGTIWHCFRVLNVLRGSGVNEESQVVECQKSLR